MSFASVSNISSGINSCWLKHLFKIYFQKTDTQQNLGFHQKYQIPNVIGVIDGRLIAIKAPTGNMTVFVCRTEFHLLTVKEW